MLEVDEDSRLGRELMAGGTRYHAHFVPDDAATVDFYVQACETLNAAGLEQYEISNFAQSQPEARGTAEPSAGELGWQSRHNLKYWTRQPYLGFGVDAHSMLPAAGNIVDSREEIRIAMPDSLDGYMNRAPVTFTPVSTHAALEETFFLGLPGPRSIPGRGNGIRFDCRRLPARWFARKARRKCAPDRARPFAIERSVWQIPDRRKSR
jgi:oxygen-independent coproporphyrinogen-3 oxidase